MNKKLLITPENLDGVLVDMTAEEIAQSEKDNAREEDDAVTKIEKNEALKSSAKAKLIAGEPLTEEEADTLLDKTLNL